MLALGNFAQSFRVVLDIIIADLLYQNLIVRQYKTYLNFEATLQHYPSAVLFGINMSSPVVIIIPSLIK